MAASTLPARVIGPAVVLLMIAWALSLPLHDVLAYPDRLSVLPNLETDAPAYHAIASDLARTWSPMALPRRHPPGWVTLLAVVYSLAGPSFVAGKLVSWIALVAAVAGCATLARRIWSPAAGWVAAVLCATSPALRGYVGTLQYEVVTAAMLLGVVLLTDAAARSLSSRALHQRATLAGLAAGALVLTRETFLIAIPLIALWLAVRVRGRVKPRAVTTGVVLMTGLALIPAAIWSAAQSIRYRSPVVISDKGPLVMAFGNNPLANGTYNAPLVGVGEPTGLAFVRQAPGRSLVLAGRKALYFWGVLRDGWNVPRPGAVWAWRASTGLMPFDLLTAVARGGWLLVVFLAALWWLGSQGWRSWWVLPAIVCSVMAVHLVTLSSHRFAVPVLPIVFVLASGPLTAVARQLSTALRAPAIAAAATLLLLIIVAMQFQRWPLAHTYRAVDLDGLQADNLVDPVTGRGVRFAAASRGDRPVLLLPDEYLPAGSLTLDVRLRRASAVLNAAAPMARITLVQLDGRIACAYDVTAGGLLDDRVTAIEIPCWLSTDTPATVAVHSLGGADFAIDAVRLAWNSVSLE